MQCKVTLPQSREHTPTSTNTNMESKFMVHVHKIQFVRWSATAPPVRLVVRWTAQSGAHQNVSYHYIRDFLSCANRHETQSMIQFACGWCKYLSSNAYSGSHAFMWSATRSGYRSHQEICNNDITWLWTANMVGRSENHENVAQTGTELFPQTLWSTSIKCKQFSPTKSTLFAFQVQEYVRLTAHT
jgi:hypothetical protein